jgi:hypothetical protein
MPPALAAIAAKLGPRGVAAAGGGAALALILIIAIATGGGTPKPAASNAPGQSGGPSPAASAAASASAGTGTEPGAFVNVLPTPATTDVVLLVGSVAAPTADEQRWLTDLRSSLGNVDTLSFKDASLDSLRAYLVVFVTESSSDLDPAVLAQAYKVGLTIHLIGPAASYDTAVRAGDAP